MQLDVAAISDRLFDEFAARPALWVSNDEETAWHRPGLVSYWVGDAGRDDLESVLGTALDGWLLHLGRATAEHEGEHAVRGTMWGHVALGLLGRERGFHGLRTQLQLLLFPGDSQSGRWVQPWLEANVSVIGVPLSPADAVHFLDVVVPPVPPLYRVGAPQSTAQARLAEVTIANGAARRARSERRLRWMAEVRAEHLARRASRE
jgi:hypothetical protein